MSIPGLNSERGRWQMRIIYVYKNLFLWVSMITAGWFTGKQHHSKNQRTHNGNPRIYWNRVCIVPSAGFLLFATHTWFKRSATIPCRQEGWLRRYQSATNQNSRSCYYRRAVGIYDACAISMKKKTAPAHIIVQRLTNSFPSDRLTKAFTNLGRIIKTEYILRYLTDKELGVLYKDN